MLAIQPILQLQNIMLQIPANDQPILDNINYEINSGDFIILLGSNGSGKSSLLKLLDRRYFATSGEILFVNKPINKYSQQQFSQDVISLTQNVTASLFTSFTILENCKMALQRKQSKSFDKKGLRLFFTDYLIKFNINLAYKLDEIAANLSGGEQQALALALSMIYPPKLFLLDEHTSALDPKTAANIMQLTNAIIAKNKITCILATHNLDIAANYGNKILVLRNGKILQKIDKTLTTKFNKSEFLQTCY